ncbi:probable serine/threonine-protein kinase PBL18 [Cynara cardunculus var. scolymus]|uniref:probable serine/threonine-protein kinase PBL18 n=1 Tax=Cynara cardunculus var. scolymus TaxID=59895 RepID=UPI000D62525F|nr:probable serine/threonine-protein kinase PBL18 [Cynara cardunculus var. scolymus]
MGNCFGNRTNDVKHCSNYVQPHTAGGAKEPYRSNSIKKLSHPLPPPPQHIYPQKLPSPRHETEMILFSPHLKSFTFNELRNATRNFFPNYLLGEGGFGYVYKGWLNKETLTPVEPRCGIAVAIKKLKPEGFQGHKEWLSEITYLGRLQHPNLVNLFGFCCEGKNRLLVYEFMPRGSLENHLFRRGAQPLSWALRVKIAVDAARGLAFLHASESKIIYRDFKSSNILLNMDYSAKLSDFGLAKDGPTGDRTHVSTRVIGTEGYAAPEYMATGRLTTKCDVYSFGIVLLEIITGRRVIDRKQVSEEQKLLEWVKPQLRDPKKLFRIMDTKLEGRYPRKGAYVVANLALQCCHSEAKYRPHMSEVLSILERVPCGRPDHHQNRISSPRSESSGHSPYDMSQSHGSPVQWSLQGSPVQWSLQGSPLMPPRS